MIYSKNEWDPLQRVLVGTADSASTLHPAQIGVRTVMHADKTDEEIRTSIVTGHYPDKVIQEANEDLAQFVDFLTSLGIKVNRPCRSYASTTRYCPRDSVLIHKDRVIGTPMPIRSRRHERLAYRCIRSKLESMHNLTPLSLYNLECVGNPNVLALTEEHPAFDAANCLRANDDILYLVSNSGNKAGAYALQEKLGGNVRVHLLEGVYSYMHIDSTVAFLREGLMLLNPSRIKDKAQLPAPFNTWDAIWCPEPYDIGCYKHYNYASKWINMNLFSINPNLVVVEEHQIDLAKELNKYGIESKLLPMRHQRTLGGGFHCVTLDILRCGK